MTDGINRDTDKDKARAKARDKHDTAHDPDARASESEQASAAAFGNLVDDLLAGKSIAPALEADQRELLSTAGALRASMSETVLDDGRRDSIIDAALISAALGTSSAALGTALDPRLDIASRPKGTAAEFAGAAVTPLHRRKRGPVFRYAPWAVSAVACAAAVSLLLTRPTSPSDSARAAAASPTEHRLAERHLSRTSDLLIGQIAPHQADQASRRLEIIFADRMAGYRELRLEGLAQRAPRLPRSRKGATQ